VAAEIPHRPFIWGHRGASRYAPENSMAAFRLAMDIGADGIEMDAFSTRDGALIINHDGNIQVGEHKVAIPSLTLEEIRATPAGVDFPTFLEVLDEFQPKQVPISIDVRDLPTIRKLLAVLEDYEAFHLVDVCVDVPRNVRKAREISENAMIVFSPAVAWSMNDTPALLQRHMPYFLEMGVKAVNFTLKYYEVHPDLVPVLHANHLLAYVWDVHLQSAMKSVMTRDLDAVYTNYPDRFKTIRDGNVGNFS
jgi:glycerophosphoryl diester phosphodiesterase